MKVLSKKEEKQINGGWTYERDSWFQRSFGWTRDGRGFEIGGSSAVGGRGFGGSIRYVKIF